jgi:hypothetical protein
MAAALTARPVAPVAGRHTTEAPRRRSAVPGGPVGFGRPARSAGARGAAHLAAPRLSAWRYRCRRVLALLVAAEVLLGAALLLAAGVTAVVTSTASPAVSAPLVVDQRAADPQVIVVREGDTLWSIARELDPDGDPRALVARLVERSGGAGLRPGQRLRVDGLR